MPGKGKRTWGQRLVALHNRNAWVLAVLAVTGLILPWAWFRRHLPRERVWLRELHIAAGVVSILILLYYFLFLIRHIRRLKTRTQHLINLVLSLFLLLGLAVSGTILWQLRHLPSAWGPKALYVHDIFSWVGIPYLLYHSLTRWRWVRRPGYKPEVLRESAPPSVGLPAEDEPAGEAGQGASGVAASQTMLASKAWQSSQSSVSPPSAASRQRERAARSPTPGGRPISRRRFLQGAVAVAVAAAVGPAFVRWLFQPFQSGGGGLAGGGNGPQNNAAGMADANAMAPLPEPAPDSDPPLGGGASGEFRIYTVTEMPKFSAENWSFTIDGLVEAPQHYSWEDFLQIPRKVQVNDFHCVTGWIVNHCTWEGVPLADLLRLAKVKPQATQVKFISGDGVYTDALTLEQAAASGVMAAVLLDGKLLPRDLGGPVRLIVPQMYGYKSVKWLTRLELIDTNHIGYWEQRGYDKDAYLNGQMVDHPELEYGS